MKMNKKTKEPKEVPRFYISLAKIFQSLAYLCLFIGCMALLAVIIGLIITYWPQSEPSLDGGFSTEAIYNSGWGGMQVFSYMFILSGTGVVIFEIIVGVLAVIVAIWAWKLAVRTMRRLTWRLADQIMKPLATIEPISLLTVWALVILGVWLIVDAKLFWAVGFTSLILMVFGLLNFLIMRKIAGSRLDYTRAELVLGRQWRR
jgi:hypothetical protein